MRATCPSCSRQFNIPDDKIGDMGLKVRCPGCRTISRFFKDGAVEGKDDAQAQTPAQEPAPAPRASQTEAPAKAPETPKAPEPKPKPEPKVEPAPRPVRKVEPETEIEYKGGRGESISPFPKGLKSTIPPKAMMIIGALGVLVIILFAIIIFSLSGDLPEPPQPAISAKTALKSNRVRANEAFAKALEQEGLWTARGREDATELYKQVLNFDPSRTEAHARLAMITIINGFEANDAAMIDKGCQDTQNLTEDVQSKRYGRLAMGWCRLAKKDYKGALEQAQAITYIAEPVDGAAAKSLTEMEEAERDRKVAEGYVLAAMAYGEKKSQSLMLESLKAALARDPDNFKAHMELAQYWAGRRKWDTALSEAQLALKISPDHSGAKNAAEVYEAKLKAGPEEQIPGDKAELSTEKQKKSQYNSYVQRAKNMRHGGDYNGAIGQLMKADKLIPGTATVALELGWVYLNIGSTEAAIDSFNRAAKAGSAWAYYGLGAAYQAKGDSAGAKTNYEMFLKLKPNASAAPEVQSILNNM